MASQILGMPVPARGPDVSMRFGGRKGDPADPGRRRSAGPDSGAGPGSRRPGVWSDRRGGGALRASPGGV